MKKMDEKKRPYCLACGKPFDKHLGIIGTCKKYQEARDALIYLMGSGGPNSDCWQDAVENANKVLRN